MCDGARTLRVADDPDSLHRILIARNVLEQYAAGDGRDFGNPPTARVPPMPLPRPARLRGPPAVLPKARLAARSRPTVKRCAFGVTSRTRTSPCGIPPSLRSES